MRSCCGMFLGMMMVVAACSKEQAGPAQPKPNEVPCTEIGCFDGLRVTLEKATPWAAGDYTFAFEVDGKAVTCTGALPLKGCDTGPSLTCDPAKVVQIGESGCALEPKNHGFSDISISKETRAVKLKISLGDQVVHEGTMKPTYQKSRPNGEGCEPTCNAANELIKLP